MLDKTGYSAPALEKGLDVLETLAVLGAPMTTREIAEKLGRSKSEIFRMIHVLIGRGYIVRQPGNDSLALSNKLLSLAIQTPGTRDLVTLATPVIARLAQEIRQSVHIVVANRGETVVIAAVSGSTDMNFTLKLGYRRPLVDAHSGLVLLAFQPARARERMVADSLALMKSKVKMKELAKELDEVLKRGSIVRDSRDIVGITDIAAPVLDDGRAIATVSVAYVNRRGAKPEYGAILAKLLIVCSEISVMMELSRAE